MLEKSRLRTVIQFPFPIKAIPETERGYLQGERGYAFAISIVIAPDGRA